MQYQIQHLWLIESLNRDSLKNTDSFRNETSEWVIESFVKKINLGTPPPLSCSVNSAMHSCASTKIDPATGKKLFSISNVYWTIVLKVLISHSLFGYDCLQPKLWCLKYTALSSHPRLNAIMFYHLMCNVQPVIQHCCTWKSLEVKNQLRKVQRCWLVQASSD